MKRSRFSEEQIIGILREVESGEKNKPVCATHNIPEGTYFTWKHKYGGMEIDQIRRLKALEDENGRIKRLVADISVQNRILMEVNLEKMASPASKSLAVRMSVEEGFGNGSSGMLSYGLESQFFLSIQQSMSSVVESASSNHR